MCACASWVGDVATPQQRRVVLGLYPLAVFLGAATTYAFQILEVDSWPQWRFTYFPNMVLQVVLIICGSQVEQGETHASLKYAL